MTSILCYQGQLLADSKVPTECKRAGTTNMHFTNKLHLTKGLAFGNTGELLSKSQLAKASELILKIIIHILKGGSGSFTKDLDGHPDADLYLNMNRFKNSGTVGLFVIELDDVLHTGAFYDDITDLHLASVQQPLSRGSGDDFLQFAVTAGVTPMEAMEIAIAMDHLSGGPINYHDFNSIEPYVYTTPIKEAMIENAS